MRKVLIAAAGAAALVAGAAGFALAQSGGADSAEHGHRGGGFFQADANNDGAVTRQEYDARREALFVRLDADHDGQLAGDEMRGMHRGWGGHRGGRGGMHMMARLDANNDGSISRDEFLARPLAMFARMDKNNDGVISADERPHRREAAVGQEGQRRDRPDFDVNNDRQISRAEFQAMGARMFERLDANGDGRVTREEALTARGHRGSPDPQEDQ